MSNHRYFLLSFFCALIASTLVLILNQNSLVISFDSWSYWEAATSIAQGHGYKSLLGNYITAWPPLFPLYLSLWTGADKYLSLAEIKASLFFLAFACTFTWSMVVWSEFKEKSSAVIIGNVFILFVTPQFFNSFLSETLWIPLVGLLFIITSQKSFFFRKKTLVYNLLFSFVFLLCLMTRNISVILGPLFLLFFYLKFNFKIALRLSLFLLPSYIVWIGWRLISGQSSSHSPTPNFALFADSINDLFIVFLDLLGPRSLHLNFLVFLLLIGTYIIYLFDLRKSFLISTGSNSPPLGATKLKGGSAIRRKNSVMPRLLAAGIGILALRPSPFLLAFFIGIPTNETRFYYLSILTLFISLISLVFFDDKKSITLHKFHVNISFGMVAKLLILILMLTYVYRTLFFINLSWSYTPKFSDDFFLSEKYITSLILRIEQETDRGTDLDDAAKQYGISANRFLVWKSQLIGRPD